MRTSSPHAPLLLRWLVLPLLLLGGTLGGRPARAEPTDALIGLRKSHAKRLGKLADAAKDAHLAAVALRLFQQANGLDPELAEARLALGWTRDGSDWKAPDPRIVAGAGWADDGEQSLARFERQEAAARLEHGKDLVEAALAAQVRKAPPAEVERLLWAAIAADPDDPAPRQVLGHKQDGGRFVAPEHAALLTAMRAKAWRERAAQWPSIAITEGKAEGALVPGFVPTVRVTAGPVPDVAVGTGDAGTVRAAARGLAAARTLLDELLGAPAEARSALTFAVVGTRAAFESLLAAGGLNAEARASAQGWASWPLSSGATYALLAGRPSEAAVEAAGATAEADANGRGGGGGRARWLTQGLACFVSEHATGRAAGYAAYLKATAGDAGPLRRPGESVAAFARRMVAWEQDPSLREISADEGHVLHPRDVAKVGSILEWLALLGADRFKGFVLGVLSTPGSAGARLEAATKAAGFDDPAAFEASWRRFVLDLVEAAADPASERKEAWKITKLDRAKKLPAAEALHGDPVHEVTGSLWLGGRPYPCEVVEGGAAVKLYPLTQRAAYRFLREPGVAPFTIPAEYGGGFTEIRVELLREGKGWTVKAADAWQGSVDGHVLTFFDVDLDGRFGGFDRDGVLVGDGLVMQPLRRELVIGAKVYEIRRVAPDGQAIAWRSRPLGPAKGPELEAFLRWNEWRVAGGAPALLWDATLAASEQRRLAAEPPSTAPAPAGGPVGAVEAWMRGPSAAALLDPDVRAGGVVRAGAALVPAFAPADGAAPSAFVRGPFVAPGPDLEGVAPGAEGAAGPPIVLRWPDGTDVPGLAPEVTLSTASGTAVGLGAPAIAGATATCLPAAPLQPKLAYRVVARFGPSDGRTTRTWTFTTGAR